MGDKPAGELVCFRGYWTNEQGPDEPETTPLSDEDSSQADASVAPIASTRSSYSKEASCLRPSMKSNSASCRIQNRGRNSTATI